MFYDLKSIGITQAQKAIDKGATLSKINGGFYSGGACFNHVLDTPRTRYRVSDWVFKSLKTPEGLVIKTIG